MPELVDSHCHINFEPLANDLERVLSDAEANHISHMLCVSVNLQDLPEVKKLAADYKHIFASVGVHPNERMEREATVDELLQLADDPNVVAIGETGLDYFRCEGDMTWQQQRFRTHIQVAKACNKPLIIHNRDAGEDTLKILAEEGASEVGGVMHCFVDSWETAQRAMELNFYISFSGIVTFKSAEDLRSVAKRVPDDRILVETDAPYLAPVPFRGKTNEPAFVYHVAECLAELRQQNFDDFSDKTTENFFSLFHDARRTGQNG